MAENFKKIRAGGMTLEVEGDPEDGESEQSQGGTHFIEEGIPTESQAASSVEPIANRIAGSNSGQVQNPKRTELQSPKGSCGKI